MRFLIHLVLIQNQLRYHRLHLLLLLLEGLIHSLILRNNPIGATLVLNWLLDEVTRLMIRPTPS